MMLSRHHHGSSSKLFAGGGGGEGGEMAETVGVAASTSDNERNDSSSSDHFSSAVLPGDSFPATDQHLLPAHSFDDVDDEEEGDGSSEDEREILRRLGQSQARMEQVREKHAMRSDRYVNHIKLKAYFNIVLDKANVGQPEGLHRCIVATDGGEQGELEWGCPDRCDTPPKQPVHKVRDLNLVVCGPTSRCFK